MARKNTIKLLLVNSSDNETERLVSIFRRAGKVARATRAGDPAALAELVAQPWDLLIADDQVEALPAATVLALLREQNVALPALVITTSADPAALFEAGARDVLSPAEEPRLIGAALRELEYRSLRQQLAESQRDLEAAEQRNALLLGESAQAIAYVTGGMIAGASERFAERFGYPDGDAIDCVPIIDLVAADSQDAVKAALKSADGSAVAFEGMNATGETFLASLQLVPSTYDGEPCLQVTVGARDIAHSTRVSERDESGLYGRQWFIDHVTPNSGNLLAIAIDNFAGLRRQFGLAAAHRLTAAVGAFLSTDESLANAALARVADDVMAVTVSADRQAAHALGEQLCQTMAEHIIELDGHSLHCTISVGATAITNLPAEALLDQAVAATDRLREERGNDGVGNAVAWSETAGHESLQRGALSPEATLQEALEDERFQLLYQPVISLRGGRGEHYEALLRLSGDSELALPDNLIGALSVCVDNAKLDRWVLLEATKRLSANRARGHDTRLLINLTASALQDEGLCAWLAVALKAADLPPEALVLQLREADVINYLKPARDFVAAVAQLGCQTAIAGFGRAVEPLKTLKTVPVGLVQLDGAFTRELQTGGNAAPLKELVGALTSQSIKVVIPFVENAAVLATLWQVGADFIQGHYLQPPSDDMNYEFADIA